MKKLLLILLAIATCSVMASAAVYGDVDGDGDVTAGDVTVLYNYLLSGDSSGIVNGDVDGDGNITSADITLIYNILLGVPSIVSHDYVDLGLPSGTLWATMNVGATSPEDYGDYFAWGETTPKEVYNWTTYKWCNGSYNTMTKYCTKASYGLVDNKTVLDPEDDAATANWGPEWCMPTKEQQDELRNNCTKTWTTINGVKGCLLTSNINGASVFFPAAGFRWDTTLFKNETDGFCWSNALNANGSGSWSMYFSSGTLGTSNYSRGYGQSVRAVRVSQK